jgi:hypothetical protein
MTFIDRIESLSTRFLSDRTHELIVAPALADLQHDSGDSTPSARGCFSVVVALAGAAYEELTSDLRVLKFVGLTLIPALYYASFFMLVLPQASTYFMELTLGVAFLSLAPVLVCCWPERAQRRSPKPDVADA